MRKQHVYYCLSLVVAIFVASCYFLSTNASAAQGITISPLRNEVDIAPGTTYLAELRLTNSAPSSVTLLLTAESFNVVDQNYSYSFATTSPETSWVDFSQDSVTLLGEQSASIAYSIRVPLDAEPGGYYLALFAATQPPEDQAGIAPVSRLASLQYISVPGAVNKSGELLSLQSPLVAFGPSNWSATIKHPGTAHFRSYQKTTVYSVFGQPVTTSEDSWLILPRSVRLTNNDLPVPGVMGVYRLAYSISLGDAAPTTIERWFLYLPPLQLVLILAIVAGCVVLIRSRRRD